MTLNNATKFFENLVSKTDNKSEIKVYEKFIHILNELKTKELLKEQIQSVEIELENLKLKSNPNNRKKYFNKALNKFESYLKETFSLTPKGYYANMGIGLGLSFGILFGIVFLSSLERSLGITLGLSFGMLIGLAIGKSLDSKAKSEDRMI